MVSIDYTTLFRTIPHTCIIFSADYDIVEATDLYLNMTMRTREDIVGRNVFEAFPDNPNDPDSRNTVLLKKSLDLVKKTKEVDIMDILRYDIPKPSGLGGGFDTRYWEVSHNPVLNVSGEILFIIQKTIDVTERELAKQSVSDSEGKFNFLAESMPLMVWTTNADGKTNYLNQKWSAYTGLPLEKLLGTGWTSILHPDDVSETVKKWETAAKSLDTYQAQTRLRDKQGNYRWHLIRGVVKKDKKDNVVMWIGSCTDIHDNKMMIEELLSTNEKMSHLSDQVQVAYGKAEFERQILHNLIMEAPASICILKGPEHTFELINPNYQKLFQGREIINKPVLEALPEIKGQGFKELLDNVYNTGEKFVGNELLVKFDRNNTGSLEEAYFTFTYQALYENKKIVGIVVYANEVTEHVQLKKKIQELHLENK